MCVLENRKMKRRRQLWWEPQLFPVLCHRQISRLGLNFKFHLIPSARWNTAPFELTFTRTHAISTSRRHSQQPPAIDTFTLLSVCWTTKQPPAPSTSTPIRHKSIKSVSMWRCGTTTCRRKWPIGSKKRTRTSTRTSSKSPRLNR